MNKARSFRSLQVVIIIIFLFVLPSCSQFTPATPTATPTATLVPTPLPTNTVAPRPLSETLLTLPELNSVFQEIDKNVWQKDATLQQLQLIPDIAAGIKGSIEEASANYVGTVVFDSDSVIQLHIQKWETAEKAANAIEPYTAAHDVNYEATKNMPGIFITSSNTKDLPNGKVIVDSLGIDQLNPIVYTAIIHGCNSETVSKDVRKRLDKG